MSCTILKSLVIKNNEVFTSSCASNVYPKYYEQIKSNFLTDIYTENGVNEVLKILTIDTLYGCIKIAGSTKLLKTIKEGVENIKLSTQYIELLNRQHFLESKIFTKERDLYIDEYRSLNKAMENVVNQYYK